jgi:hypothetical protein
MSHFANHTSKRTADIESEFAHARYIVVPALLWALAFGGAVIAGALQDERESAPAQMASPEAVPVVPLDA